MGRSSGGDFYVITNTAHLRPGGPTGFGVLELSAAAAYLWLASLLTVRIAETTAGLEHDQLRGNNSLWLGGQLRIEFAPGFTPAVGQKFLIVSADSRLQNFRSGFERLRHVEVPRDRRFGVAARRRRTIRGEEDIQAALDHGLHGFHG